MNPDSHRDPKERILHLLGDHLQSNPLRRMGPQRAGLRPCAREPQKHPHHPSDEPCPECPPPAVVADKSIGQQAYDYYLPEGDWANERPERKREWEEFASRNPCAWWGPAAP